MKKFQFLIAVQFCFSFSFAQSNLQTIIDSELINDDITMQIISGKLNFSIDNGTPDVLPNKINLQSRKKQISFNTHFIHPLKYKVSLKNELIDDELLKAAQAYFTEFTSYFTYVNNKSSSNTNSRIIPSEASSTLTLKNPHLIELFAMLNGWSRSNFFSSQKAVAFSDEFLEAMGKMDDSKKTKILENYEVMFDNIWEIDSYDDIKIKIQKNESLKDTIDSAILEIQEEIKSLERESQRFIKKYIEKNGSDAVNQNYMNLVKLKIDMINKDFETFNSKKEVLDSKYSSFKKLLNKIQESSFYDKGIKKIRIDDINLEADKISKVTIHLKSYEYNKQDKSITEKEEKKFEFHIRKYRRFVPIVSSGVMYTSLSFATFGTDTNSNGENIVVQSNSKDNELAIGAFLNLYLNNGWNNPVFFQVGFGPSKEKPLIFSGLGINLSSRISLSSGAIFTWQPTLTTLKLGDKVSGTSQIDDDINFSFSSKPKFYLGISVDLN